MPAAQYIGIAASIFTGAALVPQLYTMYGRKKVTEISVPVLILLFTGCGLWVGYGVEKEDPIIIISNGFSLAVNVGLWVGWFRYRKA